MSRRTLTALVLISCAISSSLPVTLATSVAAVRGAPPVPAGTNLIVSAAISLKQALNDVAKLYKLEHPNTTVTFNLSGSGTLQRQIEQGAPVDVFISASPKEMDALESKGLLLQETRRNLVRNSVVLIVPAGTTEISSFQNLTKPAAKIIAIGEPQTVPAGKYAQEVLTHFGLYEQIKSKLVLAKDVRQVLTYVETGNADAGIVYSTDAKASGKKVVLVATAPADSHEPVIYPVAVIKNSANPAAAKSFVDFLASAKGRDVFQKYGFVQVEN